MSFSSKLDHSNSFMKSFFIKIYCHFNHFCHHVIFYRSFNLRLLYFLFSLTTYDCLNNIVAYHSFSNWKALWRWHFFVDDTVLLKILGLPIWEFIWLTMISLLYKKNFIVPLWRIVISNVRVVDIRDNQSWEACGLSLSLEGLVAFTLMKEFFILVGNYPFIKLQLIDMQVAFIMAILVWVY